MTTIKYTMYTVQGYNGLYNNAFLPVLWHLTHKWKTCGVTASVHKEMRLGS